MTTYNTAPICVGHINAIQESLGLNATDMAWLLGATPSRWSSICNDARLNPEQLAEPCHALLLRWMLNNPTTSPKVQSPEAGALLNRIRSAGQLVTAKSFALALGWDATAGSRWMRSGASIGPAGRRALSLLDHRSPRRLATNWTKWVTYAAHEARLRRIDLANCLGWTPSRNSVEAAL